MPVRVISILSALSISQVPVCLVCHAAGLPIATHCVDVAEGARKPCVRKGGHIQQEAVEVPSVVPQFLKNILCQMYDVFSHTGPS